MLKETKLVFKSYCLIMYVMLCYDFYVNTCKKKKIKEKVKECSYICNMNVHYNDKNIKWKNKSSMNMENPSTTI